MYRKIVVPLDGSKLAEQALEHARALAHCLGSEVILMRVMAYANYDYLVTDPELSAGLREEMEREACNYLEPLANVLQDEGLRVGAEAVVSDWTGRGRDHRLCSREGCRPGGDVDAWADGAVALAARKRRGPGGTRRGRARVDGASHREALIFSTDNQPAGDPRDGPSRSSAGGRLPPLDKSTSCLCRSSPGEDRAAREIRTENYIVELPLRAKVSIPKVAPGQCVCEPYGKGGSLEDEVA